MCQLNTLQLGQAPIIQMLLPHPPESTKFEFLIGRSRSFYSPLWTKENKENQTFSGGPKSSMVSLPMELVTVTSNVLASFICQKFKFNSDRGVMKLKTGTLTCWSTFRLQYWPHFIVQVIWTVSVCIK